VAGKRFADVLCLAERLRKEDSRRYTRSIELGMNPSQLDIYPEGDSQQLSNIEIGQQDSGVIYKSFVRVDGASPRSRFFLLSPAVNKKADIKFPLII
jgi:hypothetical protein